MPQLSTLDFRLGLIGYPLNHSLSPKIHTAALRACGLHGDYSLFPIPLDDRQALKNLMIHVRSGKIHGLNVTIPHKQNVMSLLDDLTPTAQTIRAVNTIYLHDNQLMGDNTDASGFLVDLKNFLTTGTPHVRLKMLKETCGESRSRGDSNALVLGSGGSARAVVYALLNDQWNVTIAARRMEQAQHIANSITNNKLRIMSYADLRSSTFDLLINTTPVGMTPDTDQSPWPEGLPFPAHAAIYDLVYNPRQTKLVKDARSQGLHATTGLGMLIEQAALSFEIWTGHNPSREIMRSSILQTDKKRE